MSGNPLDMIVGFVFKIIFGFVLGFVGIFIATWIIGSAGAGIVAIFGGDWQAFTITDTSAVLDAAFSFMEAWFPYAWYIFQWITWLLIGSWTGWFPQPIAPWM
jgi:Na+/citrate or Na+/malate symporter